MSEQSKPSSRQADNRRPTHSLDSRCTVQGCPECDHAPCPIPTPPGYEPCWKGRGHSGLHDFRRMDAPARSRVLTLPCSSCGRSRTECRTVDEPFLSCCRACAADDGDTHRPTPPSRQSEREPNRGFCSRTDGTHDADCAQHNETVYQHACAWCGALSGLLAPPVAGCPSRDDGLHRWAPWPDRQLAQNADEGPS